jgi:hypothetical protein
MEIFPGPYTQDENSGGPNELRDAKDVTISREKIDYFVRRHEEFEVLVPEPNDVMQNSYLLLDEKLRFLNSSDGGIVPSESILDVGVEAALGQTGFVHHNFYKLGGVYNFKIGRVIARKNLNRRGYSYKYFDRVPGMRQCASYTEYIAFSLEKFGESAQVVMKQSPKESTFLLFFL